MTGASLLRDALHFLFAVAFYAVVIYGLFFGHKKKKSPDAYRRERQYRQSEKASQRYERIPPIIRLIDQEKRWRKARRSAVAAISWALLAKDFNPDEIAGAVVLAVRKDREVVFDHDRFYESCLQILRRATREEGS